ncbi:unnamed protein product [Owenia fusiformis]|uniref:Uncharacterized protein n=1 Tax=Owenia fusiformis TaxID=6347 RepID=A0A8J1U194_OWEFU|nr:unnamed protein product [Owenia fusiformis]
MKGHVIHVIEFHENVKSSFAPDNATDHGGENINAMEIEAKSDCKDDVEDTELHNFCYNKTILMTFMRPIMFSMRCCGLFYNLKHKRQKDGTIKRMFSKWQLYSLMITIVVTLNCIRSVCFYFGKNEMDHHLFFKLTMTVWWAECSAKSLNHFVACAFPTKMQTLFKGFDTILKGDTTDVYKAKIVKLAKVTTFKLWAFCFINVLGAAVCLYGPHELQDLFNLALLPIPINLPVASDIFKVINLIIHFINSMVAIFPMGLYAIVCTILYEEFKILYNDFTKEIKDDGDFDGNLEQIRMRHQLLCKIVENADNVFSFYIAAVYATNLPLACVVLYNLIYHQLHIYQVLLNCFWVSVVVTQTSVVSLLGGLVNKMVSFNLSIATGRECYEHCVFAR